MLTRHALRAYRLSEHTGAGKREGKLEHSGMGHSAAQKGSIDHVKLNGRSQR